MRLWGGKGLQQLETTAHNQKIKTPKSTQCAGVCSLAMMSAPHSKASGRYRDHTLTSFLPKVESKDREWLHGFSMIMALKLRSKRFMWIDSFRKNHTPVKIRKLGSKRRRSQASSNHTQLGRRVKRRTSLENHGDFLNYLNQSSVPDGPSNIPAFLFFFPQRGLSHTTQPSLGPRIFLTSVSQVLGLQGHVTRPSSTGVQWTQVGISVLCLWCYLPGSIHERPLNVVTAFKGSGETCSLLLGPSGLYMWKSNLFISHSARTGYDSIGWPGPPTGQDLLHATRFK